MCYKVKIRSKDFVKFYIERCKNGDHGGYDGFAVFENCKHQIKRQFTGISRKDVKEQLLKFLNKVKEYEGI